MINCIDYKTYLYCPRQIYYKYILCVEMEETIKMNHGKFLHNRMIELEQRRGFIKYGLENYVKKFNVKLKSEKENLIGVVDMILEDSNNAYPVDFKMTETFYEDGYKIQLYCYKKLIEDVLNKNPNYGYIYYISSNKIKKVDFTEEYEILYQNIKSRITEIIDNERLPDVYERNRCSECEYINYCNDIA